MAAGLPFVPLPLRFALIETSSLSDAAGQRAAQRDLIRIDRQLDASDQWPVMTVALGIALNGHAAVAEHAPVRV